MVRHTAIGLLVVLLAQTSLNLFGQTTFEIQPDVTYVSSTTFNPAPGPGDIVKILAPRAEALKFVGLEGDENQPITFINSGGQVNIHTNSWGALEFLDCKHIKLSGRGDPKYRYGFKLFGSECGLALAGYSSDCEVEFVEILGDDDTFFGIYAKKDFSGVPPLPYPQFNNLLIHDTYIHDVSEGMYIGETVSPGMEFRHVRVYNNIVENTHRECIQIANCVEDIEIYNNVLLNAGLHQLNWQDNILVIGGNSVGRVYNNILRNAPGFGIQIFGIGNIEVNNNYLENNKGVFIDNRYWHLEGTPIILENNYFTVQTSWEVIKNMNEFNHLYIRDNRYDSNNSFFYNASSEPPVLYLDNNQKQELDLLEFSIADGIFKPNTSITDTYNELGPEYFPSFVIERLFLNPDMIIDRVPSGSNQSPNRLVDEQFLDPEKDEHPNGGPWKPVKKRFSGPYHVEVDLGSEYYLDRILLHDYRKSGVMEISYLENNQWIVISTDPLINNNVWNEHPLEINCQRIRLTMLSDNANINEIALYGYSIGLPTKNAEISTERFAQDKLQSVKEAVIYPNPASEYVTIDWIDNHFTSEIIDSQGRILLSSDKNIIDVSNLTPGLYFIRMKQTNSDQTEIKRLLINH